MTTFLKWLACLPLAYASTLICWLLAPLVAVFTRREARQDVVKRQNKAIVLMDRDYLLPIFNWFTTHDNAADEWWYGMYNTDFYLKGVREWTQADYDTSWWIRYFCRLAWLYRNPAYGFAHRFLRFKRLPGYMETRQTYQRRWCDITYIAWRNPGAGKAINIKGDIYLSRGWRINFNLGYKAHKGFLNLMIADRVCLRRIK